MQYGSTTAFSVCVLVLAILVGSAPTHAFASTKVVKNGSRSTTQLNVEPTIIFGAVASAAVATWWVSGADEREKKAKYAQWEAKEREYQEERERLAYIEPKETWREEELKAYDGTDEKGPLLMAVKGDVFNVWRGRHFYGPGAEYHIMAGKCALSGRTAPWTAPCRVRGRRFSKDESHLIHASFSVIYLFNA